MRRVRQFFRFMRVLLAARTVQDFLLGTPGTQTDLRPNVDFTGWIAVMDKRLVRLRMIDFNHPNWRVEARKRLLQVAAVAIAMIEWIDTLPTDYKETR